MPNNTPNTLSGHHYFTARQTIDLTLSKVASMVPINRNKLSEFEKEKATLSASEKRLLTKFYEDRGYDFGDPDEADPDTMEDTYQETRQHLTDTVQVLIPNEVGDAILQLADATHDLLTVNGYLDTVDDEEGDVMPAEYQELVEKLLHHFDADKQGAFERKGGLFGGAGQERGMKLMALLAYVKLQDLQRVRPDTFSLSLNSVKTNSDNERLLAEMRDNLDLNSLDEFKAYTSALVK